MAKIVIEVPEEFRELGEAWEETLAILKRTLGRTGGGKAVDYAEVERVVSEEAGKSERAAHRGILQALDIDVPVRYNRVGRCESLYHTLAGSVSIERSLYRQSGTRGGQPEGKVVDAVSQRAGVVGDGWLPHTARVMAHEVQKGTSREAEATAREYGRLPYARSSFERVGHLVGALAVADHQDIEDALIDAYELPAEARSVSVSLDRVSVPMEESRRRPVGRPRKGAPKKPVERNFRMAYCGTVTVHDEKGEALQDPASLRWSSGDVEPLGRGLHPREVRGRDSSPRRSVPPDREAGRSGPGHRRAHRGGGQADAMEADAPQSGECREQDPQRVGRLRHG